MKLMYLSFLVVIIYICNTKKMTKLNLNYMKYEMAEECLLFNRFIFFRIMLRGFTVLTLLSYSTFITISSNVVTRLTNAVIIMLELLINIRMNRND